MTNRQRFQAAMRFEPTDRPCHVEYGFWPETFARWKNEGLAESIVEPGFGNVSEPNDLFAHFGIAKFGYILLDQFYFPPFPTEVLEETDDFRVIRNGMGITQRENKRNVSMPQFLDYPIKSMQDYQLLRERLRGAVEQRYPADWGTLAANLRQQTHTPFSTHMHGPFAYLRDLMGLEAMLVMFYDDPDLMKLIIADRVAANMALYERAIRDTQPDFAFIWEDMCFKNGPLVSPAIFREFMLPAYKQLTGFLKDLGVEVVLVDSDGDVRQLIPLWLEGGVTGLLPFEVRAGMDVREIRKNFPKLQIIGGIEKHKLEQTPQDIDEELNRILPQLLARGGYCVALDHWVHSDIPLKNFAYYVEKIKTFA